MSKLSLLKVEKLKIDVDDITLVEDLNFHLQKGEILAVLGQSGTGKSIVALSLLGLLDERFTVSGKIQFLGKEIDLQCERQSHAIRGRGISMVFQEPATALNPILSIGDQVAEVFQIHELCSYSHAKKQVLRLFNALGVQSKEHVMTAYPHQLSGGMQQKVMIAMAIASKPKMIIADEPLASLDVMAQAQVIALFRELNQRRNTAFLLISHHMSLVAKLAHKVRVLSRGQLKKCANLDEALLFSRPQPHAFEGTHCERKIGPWVASPFGPSSCCQVKARFQRSECLAKQRDRQA